MMLGFAKNKHPIG